MYYKSQDNTIHDDMGGAALLLPSWPKDAVQITNEEALAAVAPSAPTPDEVRAVRNARISASDWTQLPDAPLSIAEKTAWGVYRQALRDVPEQAGFPESIDWPVSPD